MQLVLFSLFAALKILCCANCAKILECYYPSWAATRSGDAQYLPEQIDPFLCTHITYVYAKLDEKTFTLSPQNPSLDLKDNNGLGLYQRIIDLKLRNPNIKILLGLGGVLDSNSQNGTEQFPNKYSMLVRDFQIRSNFITQSIFFLTMFGFDGLEIHWEYPPVEDKLNFVKFIQACKEEFQKNRLLISVSLSTSFSVMEAYDIPLIGRHADFAVLMTYDFHGHHEGTTNPLSSLFRRRGYSVDKAMQAYIEAGLPVEKMIIGIATYAKSYTLVSAREFGVPVPAVGPGIEGPLTKAPGYLSHYEVCIGVWNKVNVSDFFGMFGYNDRQWITYNNEAAVVMKARYVIYRKLIGVAFWSLDQDDFSGNYCHNGKYPLITAAKNTLFETGDHISRRSGPSNPFSERIDRCMTDGFYRDQGNCRRFYECRRGILMRRQCENSLFWDQQCLCCVMSNQQCGIIPI